jgi:hypothetical protein
MAAVRKLLNRLLAIFSILMIGSVLVSATAMYADEHRRSRNANNICG